MKKRIPAHGIAKGPSSLCSDRLRNRLGGLEHIHVLNRGATTASVAILVAACGGGNGNDAGTLGAPAAPEPDPGPAVIAVVEPAPSGHGNAVGKIAETEAHGDAVIRFENIHLEVDMAEMFPGEGGGSTSALFEGLEDPAVATTLWPHIEQQLAGLAVTGETTARETAGRLGSFHITNGSYRLDLAFVRPILQSPRWWNERWRENIQSLYEAYRNAFPRRWEALSQTGVAPELRTIRVWAAGNERETFGAEAMSIHHAKIHGFPEFRGHELVVTALAEETGEIASFANICGDLPQDWDAARHGRHYCLAARGVLPGYREEGTSYAAPRVAAALARMHRAARRTVRGSHLVRRLVNTANNAEPYTDTRRYGAGALDESAALAPQGPVTYPGPDGEQWRRATTAAKLPSAYGDAGAALARVEMMGWDSDGFPFWEEAGRHMTSARARRSPIPAAQARIADPGICEAGLALGVTTRCMPTPAARWQTAAGPHGAGAGYTLAPGITAGAYVRTEGRLDGGGRGGLTLGGGSGTLALTAERTWEMDAGDGAVIVQARGMVALDAPWRPERGMLAIGPSALSAGTVAITAVDRKGTSTRVALTQPVRAEAGRARLTWPVSRTLDGRAVFATRSVPLRPSRRAVEASVRHDRDTGLGGRLTLEAWGTTNPGHRPGAAEYGMGAAWRKTF